MSYRKQIHQTLATFKILMDHPKQTPADEEPPAAKRSKAAEQSRFYRFVDSIALQIDSSQFDSIKVIVCFQKKRNKPIENKANQHFFYVLILILTFFFFCSVPFLFIPNPSYCSNLLFTSHLHIATISTQKESSQTIC